MVGFLLFRPPRFLRKWLLTPLTRQATLIRMKLFVGLGNPGAKYAQNRHNIGFMALDRIAEDHAFSPWRTKFQGHICEGMLDNTKVSVT